MSSFYDLKFSSLLFCFVYRPKVIYEEPNFFCFNNRVTSPLSEDVDHFLLGGRSTTSTRPDDIAPCLS